MTGIATKLGRLLDGNGNAVIVAMDHGMFDGPHKGMENIPETLERLGDCPDGILLSPGMLRRCTGYFGRRNAPMAIVRLNMNSVFCFDWSYRDAVLRPAYSPEDAAALGAEIVLICHTARTGSEERDARNIEQFAKSCIEAHRLGLPVLGEYFPTRHLEKTAEELHEEVLIGCRMLEEFGADCIKTFYTHRFAEVTSKVGIPVFGLGAEKTPTDREALDLAWREMRDGARGVVFGRNAVQASNPRQFVAALHDIVKDGHTVDEVLQTHSALN